MIDLKRDARAQVVVNNLYKHTALEIVLQRNMLAIDDRRPKLLTLKDAIDCYIEHRREVIIRRTRYLLAKAERPPRCSRPSCWRSATSTTSSR